jgi:predicted RNase H-like nuclease (RuvC/YqgF family)
MQEGKDAVIEEKATPPVPSTEEKTSKETTPNASEGEKTQEEELGSGIENFDKRFKEVYREKKDLERQLAETKKPAETEAKAPETWDEAVDFIEKRMTSKAETEQKQMVEIEKKMVTDFTETKKIYPELDEDKVWDYMAEHKLLNVFEAVTKMKAEEHVSNEANKNVASKIGSASANTSGKTSMTYAELHKTSLDDITLPSNK